MTRAVLGDAVALVRGDRYYTTDFSREFLSLILASLIRLECCFGYLQRPFSRLGDIKIPNATLTMAVLEVHVRMMI